MKLEDYFETTELMHDTLELYQLGVDVSKDREHATKYAQLTRLYRQTHELTVCETIKNLGVVRDFMLVKDRQDREIKYGRVR